jgi:hypothetical protein
MAKYLDGEEIATPSSTPASTGRPDSILAPVLVGSARRASADALLDAFVRYLPTAADEAAVEAKDARATPSRSRRPDGRSSPACSRPPPTRSSGG